MPRGAGGGGSAGERGRWRQARRMIRGGVARSRPPAVFPSAASSVTSVPADPRPALQRRGRPWQTASRPSCPTKLDAASRAPRGSPSLFAGVKIRPRARLLRAGWALGRHPARGGMRWGAMAPAAGCPHSGVRALVITTPRPVCSQCTTATDSATTPAGGGGVAALRCEDKMQGGAYRPTVTQPSHALRFRQYIVTTGPPRPVATDHWRSTHGTSSRAHRGNRSPGERRPSDHRNHRRAQGPRPLRPPTRTPPPPHAIPGRSARHRRGDNDRSAPWRTRSALSAVSLCGPADNRVTPRRRLVLQRPASKDLAIRRRDEYLENRLLCPHRPGMGGWEPSANTVEAMAPVDTRGPRLRSPWREDLSQAFGMLFMRVALPE